MNAAAAPKRRPATRKTASKAVRKTAAERAPRPAADHGLSSPDQVVDAIKHGIVLGRLVPGQRLIEADLTRHHRVSRGPVREALKRLAAEGVVELSRHRGAYIRLLTRREVLEILQALQAIVGLAVRLASVRMKQADNKARLKAAFEKLSEHGPSGDRGLQSMDRNALYDTIFAIADNRELARMHPVVPTQILRMQVYPYLSAEDRRQQFADYKLLYDAMRAGKSRVAHRVVISHIRRSRMQIRKMPDEAFAAPAE